ncbi:MAG: septal ring lytic transglycosylase RlpA family protein [Gammaproteobacteria bacterium]|nr:septal ring lytic transglycosylase RlpA family protein [Gammaproteobacteria bacterium]
MPTSFLHNRTVWSATLLLISSLLLSACGSLPHNRYGFAQDSAPAKNIDHTRVANAVPRVEPRSKYGNPKSYVVQGKRYTVRQSAHGFVQTGDASWYGTKFHGHRTSSGEPYDMYAMTAAHKTLPIPSYVEVHNLDNQRKIIVRVNDRGPFVSGRIIDLSYVAAKKLDITTRGTGRVKIRVINPAAPAKAPQASTTPVALSSPAIPQRTTTITSNPGQLYLQVGAFTNHDKASQLLNRLVSATQQNVSINRKATNNYNVYRVRIGPLRSEADALKLRTQLSPLGIDSPHIVVE